MSAADGKSIASSVVSNVINLPPSKMICHFSCKDCGDIAKEPVINVICGHLFCWSCLYRRLSPDCGQQGFLRGCPFCKSHLDISPSKSTVIPVYSGSEPGVEFSPIHNPEPEPDMEEEMKRKEAILKEKKEYVAPRPAWHNRSLYASKIDFIVMMLFKFDAARGTRKFVSKLTDSSTVDASYISCGQRQMGEVIQNLKAGWLWLTGEKYPEKASDIKPEETEKRFQIVLLPTDVNLPEISTFACRICGKTAFEPVVTICGHLFCWTCLWCEWCQPRRFFHCPICDMPIRLSASRSDINSIYCQLNDPCKEDEFLKSNRKGVKQEERQAPCRPIQNVAVWFLDYMINKVEEAEMVIKEQLASLKSSYDDLTSKQIKEACLEVNNIWDRLFADLVKEWRRCTREEVKESQLKPTFLDLIWGREVSIDYDYGTVIEYMGGLSNLIGDTWFD